MGKSQSALHFRPIARPKHVEEISGEESDIHQGWEILMCIRPSELIPDSYPVKYYIRARSPQHAAMMAAKMWMKWEKEDLGLTYHKFPDIEEAGAGRMVEEKEFREIWRNAEKSGDFKYLGMRENPSVFTYGLRDRGLKKNGPTVLVPHTYEG